MPHVREGDRRPSLALGRGTRSGGCTAPRPRRRLDRRVPGGRGRRLADGWHRASVVRPPAPSRPGPDAAAGGGGAACRQAPFLTALRRSRAPGERPAPGHMGASSPEIARPPRGTVRCCVRLESHSREEVERWPGRAGPRTAVPRGRSSTPFAMPRVGSRTSRRTSERIGLTSRRRRRLSPPSDRGRRRRRRLGRSRPARRDFAIAAKAVGDRVLPPAIGGGRLCPALPSPRAEPRRPRSAAQLALISAGAGGHRPARARSRPGSRQCPRLRGTARAWRHHSRESLEAVRAGRSRPESQPGLPRWPAPGSAGAVRVRQDLDPEDDRGDRERQRGRDLLRRPSREWTGPGRSQCGHGVRGLRAVSASHGGPEHRLPAGGAPPSRRGDPARGGRRARATRARDPRRRECPSAERRRPAASGHRAGAGPEAGRGPSSTSR